jgi:uncharacterized lipoprotein NlpE involved in copper resistance
MKIEPKTIAIALGVLALVLVVVFLVTRAQEAAAAAAATTAAAAAVKRAADRRADEKKVETARDTITAAKKKLDEDARTPAEVRIVTADDLANMTPEQKAALGNALLQPKEPK